MIVLIKCIKDKTYTYSRQKLGPSCLVSNGREVMGVLFNEKGNLIKKSSLLLDEEEEVWMRFILTKFLILKLQQLKRKTKKIIKLTG